MLALPLLLACGGTSKSSGSEPGGSPSSAGSGAGGSGAGGSPVAGGGDAGSATNGGAASGGAASGGAAPVSGAGGALEQGEAECNGDDDCVVRDDCCSCAAQPAEASSQQCDAVCVQNACAARGLAGVGARCAAKRCVFDVSCDRSKVTCRALPPECEAGLVPSVAGACWGPCVSPSDCRDVTDCDDCGAGQICVSTNYGAPLVNCVQASTECAANPTCECADACAFQCSDENGIGCFCVVC